MSLKTSFGLSSEIPELPGSFCSPAVTSRRVERCEEQYRKMPNRQRSPRAETKTARLGLLVKLPRTIARIRKVLAVEINVKRQNVDACYA